MLISYESKRLGHSKMYLIDQANEIIEDYQRQGYSLTLRQLYYQFVAKGLIENSLRSYKNLGNAISDGRLNGEISWYAIEDRTRNLTGNTHWESPAQILESAAKGYRIDKWENQPNRVEVWVEKEALAGIVAKPARELDVDYFCCRGYVSQSEQWRAGRRHKRYIAGGQNVVIIHLGDHDPSGIDMTRDIRDRVRMFAGYPSPEQLTIKRIALNMDQVEEQSPPPNPAKLTDSRAGDYVAAFGYDSWELDALSPSYLDNLIDQTILDYRDEHLWWEATQEEQAGKDKLAELIDQISED